MEIGVRNIVIDCNDVEAMSRFWESLLGLESKWSNDTYRFMLPPDGRRPGLVLQSVPERPMGKNRVHFDLEVADVDAAVERARELGASVATKVEEEGIAWTVMTDPEGNFFCIQLAGS
jgi:predicted enzyme related to lactoylglutathione lyase